jgi:hypothetical protein
MFITYIKEVVDRWRDAAKNKQFIAMLAVTAVAFIGLLVFISYFQIYIENRSGVAFEDPITSAIPAISLDTLTFVAIYLAHIVAVWLTLKNPRQFLTFLLGELLVYIFRVVAMYLMPLDAPYGTIVLYDPFLIWFGGGEIITKDLFFSGHTATTFMAFLITTNKKAKIFVFLMLILVVCGVLLQRVHYTVDVYAAFFFAFTAYKMAKYFVSKLLVLEKV